MWAHETSLILSHNTEVPIPSQESEQSCTCVLGVPSQESEQSCTCVLGVPSQKSEKSCTCVLAGIDFASFYDFSTGYWNCSDSVYHH